MNHLKKSPTRRDFLTLLGTVTSLPLMQSPLQILIESIVLGASRNVLAQTAGVPRRKYLHISQEGAPARWSFDQFLTPYDNATFTVNGHVGTAFTGGATATGLAYSTISRQGINVPPVWAANVAKSGGGTRPMEDLLKNMLCIRGINVGNPDHGAAHAMQFLPLGAGQSMTALSGDGSPAPIPGVNASVGEYSYKSLHSKSSVTISSNGNMIATLLSPFRRKTMATFDSKRAALGVALDASILALNKVAEAQGPASRSVSEATVAAKDLLSQSFGDLTANWNSLLAKYSSLISSSVFTTQNIPGINDKAIPSDGTSRFDSGSGIVSTNDLRSLIDGSTGISNMASHFAMAEFILLNDLSDSIAISPNAFYGLLINGNRNGVYFDEHTVGSMVSLFVNAHYNLAYSACLLELIDRLKAANMFNNTVIVTGGEFGRNPRNDGSGSDHGYEGSVSAIYCGDITGPLVAGNIYRDNDPNGTYRGTWGFGAPIASTGRPLDLSHWAATIAYLLKVPSPVTAGFSLLSPNPAGGLQLSIEKARQV